MSPSTGKWPLLVASPYKTWLAPSKKVLILGDAAHAMPPYMAQAAAMAVEDGAALATVLSHVSDRSEIPFALSVFNDVRLERASAMQHASNINGGTLHLHDGPEQRARDEAMKPEVEGKHFVWSPNHWSDPCTQWWAYGYDAEEAAEKAWKAAHERDS